MFVFKKKQSNKQKCSIFLREHDFWSAFSTNPTRHLHLNESPSLMQMCWQVLFPCAHASKPENETGKKNMDNGCVNLRPLRQNEVHGRWEFPTCARLLIRVQHVSRSTLAGVRVAAADTPVLAVVTPSASIGTSGTCREDPWL